MLGTRPSTRFSVACFELTHSRARPVLGCPGDKGSDRKLPKSCPERMNEMGAGIWILGVQTLNSRVHTSAFTARGLG